MNNDENIKVSIWVKLFLGVLFFFLFVVPLVSNFWGKKEIGSFFEAPRPYEAEYYVYLFPDIEASKNYKLPANIIVGEECEGGGHGESKVRDCFGFVELDTVYFNNENKKVSFNYCRIESGDSICVDNDNNEWKVEFRGEKVGNNKL